MSIMNRAAELYDHALTTAQKDWTDAGEVQTELQGQGYEAMVNDVVAAEIAEMFGELTPAEETEWVARYNGMIDALVSGEA